MGIDAVQEAVRILAGVDNKDPVYAADCEVISVSEEDRTAQVQAIGGKARNIFTARLMAAVDDGILIIPEIESTVCVVFGNFTVPYISQYSEVKKIILLGGEFGGLVKVIEAVDRWNKIEDKVNDLIQKFNTHTHTGVQAGGGVTGTTPTTVNGTLVKTKRKDVENEKILHGE